MSERACCQQCGRLLSIWYDHFQGGFKRAVGRGYQGNGRFCTIRCGYYWALGVRPESVRRLPNK